MVESLGDVKRAVEEHLPKREWICLEGEETDPVKSLACHLNTKWSYLESLLGEVKRPKYAIQDLLGKPSVLLIRPDRSENVHNGFRYFAIGGRPRQRLCDALRVLASDAVIKEENAFNVTGRNQHTAKKRRRSFRLADSSGSYVFSRADSQTHLVPSSTVYESPSVDEPTRPKPTRRELPANDKDPADYARVGAAAAEMIAELPKGRARIVALRHFFTALGSKEKEDIAAICINVDSEISSLKEKLNIELVAYLAHLEYQSKMRRARRMGEMPDRNERDFTGIEAYAKKNGGLDTRPQSVRLCEFREFCPHGFELLSTMLTSPWKLGVESRTNQALSANGSVIISKGKKTKQRTALSGKDLENHLKGVMDPVHRAVGVVRDMAVHLRSDSECLCDGNVERALWLRNFGGTQNGRFFKIEVRNRSVLNTFGFISYRNV